MGVAKAAQLLLGVLFVCAGTVKIPRIGQAVVPDVHKNMAKDFGRYLRVSPFKGYVKCTSLQYMQFVGITELICGCLLLSGMLVGTSSAILAVIMAGASYTVYRLKEPMPSMAFPMVIMLVAIFVMFNHGSNKEKKE